MTIALALGEGLDRCRAVIVADHSAHGVQECALAISANAIAEEQSVLTRIAGKCIPDDPLEIALQFIVAICGAL